MNQEVLNYGDLVEAWKIECVVKRARHYGVTVKDLPDMQQSLILHILNFKYNPGNPAGAEEKTALIAVIDKKIIDWLRKESAAKRAIREYRRINGHIDPDGDSLLYSENPGRRHDLVAAIRSLSGRERIVCMGLSEGLSMAQIARRLCCRPQSVHHMVCHIRRVFKARGLGE